MAPSTNFRTRCANPFRKKNHNASHNLRFLTAKQQLAFSLLPEGIKICNSCRVQFSKLKEIPAEASKNLGAEIDKEPKDCDSNNFEMEESLDMHPDLVFPDDQNLDKPCTDKYYLAGVEVS